MCGVCFVVVGFSFHLLSAPREGCDMGLWHLLLDIFH